MLKTQYDEPVPDDLVVLDVDPHIRSMSDIMSAAWYEVNDILLVSFRAIKGATDTDPLDCGIDLSKLTILHRIDDKLKRCGMTYYHV